MGGPAGHPDPFVEAVAGFIDRHGLLRAGESVIVAVSGGADSVALLTCLCALAERPGRQYRLTVAHLDHALRAESAADAAFVADLAGRMGIPCVAERVDVAAEAAARGAGVEQAARELRYRFLASVAAERGATAVATAHHADDNVETVLHHILRGSHLRGLGGMAPRRDLADGVALVRPLLGVRRSEVEAFCRRRGLPWREDPTNADTALRRNLLRHELLPLLRERVNPRVDEAVLRLAEAARHVEQYLRQAADDLLDRSAMFTGQAACLDAACLAGTPEALRTSALREALRRLGVPLGQVTRKHLADLAAMAGADGPTAVNLPGGLVARRSGAELVIAPPRRCPPAGGWEVPLSCPGRTDLPDGRGVLCRTGPFDPAAFRAHCAAGRAGVEMLDADRVRGPLRCRPRRDGDAFTPLGLAGRQKVGDFLTNNKLAPQGRGEVLCVLDAEGIVYLAPLRLSERVRIQPGRTRRVLRIEILPADRPGPS